MEQEREKPGVWGGVGSCRMIVHAKQLLALSSPAFPPLRGPCMPETEYRGSATQQQMRHRLMPDRSSLTLKETATLADIPGIVSPSL